LFNQQAKKEKSHETYHLSLSIYICICAKIIVAIVVEVIIIIVVLEVILIVVPVDDYLLLVIVLVKTIVYL